MESQPQNPEFRINPENFHPCRICKHGHLLEAFAHMQQVPKSCVLANTISSH